jgi:hypothetical protein
LEQEVLLLFEIRFKQKLKTTSLKIQELLGSGGMDFKTSIWNERCQVYLVNLARYYSEYFLVKTFYNALFLDQPLALIKASPRKLSNES